MQIIDLIRSSCPKHVRNSNILVVKNITEVDLSNVTTSQIFSMKNTFQGCTSLISVNLSKFTTWAISESSKIEKF